MNIEIKDVSETRKNLVVSLDQSEVAAEHQATVAEFARMARLPGFRPGKAPAALVKKQYAREIADEFKQKVVSKAYRGGLEQAKLDVMTVTNVDTGTIAADSAATLTFTVDVRPSFTLPEYEGLPIEISPVDPTDDEVSAVIESIRGERADFKVAERGAQKGDYVKLAYEGTVDGKPIAEIATEKPLYGSVPQTWEEVEGSQEGLIPGLGKELAGLKAGDKKDVTISFPADFEPVPALAGKTATYAVNVQEIRERVLPEMDEAFFKAQQADDLEGLKNKIRNNLKARKEFQNVQAQRRQVSDALVAKSDFPVPDSLVETETQAVLRSFIEENMRRGMPREEMEKNKKQLFEGAKNVAAIRVKTQLLLAKIAEKEKIQVTDRDIDAYIYQQASRNDIRPEKLVKDLTKDRERLRAVQETIIFDKALDLLVSKAKVTTVEPKA